jgi:hypothetical protein
LFEHDLFPKSGSHFSGSCFSAPGAHDGIGSESRYRRLRARLAADAAGRITCSARANAVKGRVPK